MPDLTVSAPAGPAEAYLTGESGAPGVLFFVDAIGLRPRTREMADQVASWGYAVLVPHVFYRGGSAAALAPQVDLREPGAREEFFAGIGDRIGGLIPEQSGPDTDAWVAALREYAGTGPLGTVGYCMGARLAIRAAGRRPDDIAAVAGFHGGGLVTDHADSPHHAIATARAEMVFGHADHDGSMPPEAIAELGRTLTAAGLAHDNQVYAGAVHGYSMSDTSMFDEAAAERSFTDLRALLARTLRG